MSDEDDKPKRTYTRRKPILDVFKLNEVIEDSVDTEIESAIERGDVEDADVVEIVEEKQDTKPPRFLGEEPVNNSLKSKIAKKLGWSKSMENKPWRGKDRWVCENCNWETFDAKRAKLHSC